MVGIENLTGGSLPPFSLEGLSTLIRIGQAAGIVVIIYVAFLTLKGILGIKHIKKLARLDENVQEINKNLKLLVKYSKK